MGDNSKIHWTDASWNPVTGCSHVSPGCEHCYAESLSLRMGWTKKPWGAQHAAENVVCHPERLSQPHHWKKPRRIFVNSMSDLFHEQVPFEFILRVFIEMSGAHRHTFQVLTKRPERMLAFFRWWEENQESIWHGEIGERLGHYFPLTFYKRPWPWVWLGVSVEDQRRADERIPLLLRTPAAVRFLSCEPLLDVVDLGRWLPDPAYEPPCDEYDPAGPGAGVEADGFPQCAMCGWPKKAHDERLHWIIAGGESGPKFRPMDLDWARSLRDQCAAAGVSFFYKQGSGLRPGMNRELDGQIWEQFPEASR